MDEGAVEVLCSPRDRIVQMLERRILVERVAVLHHSYVARMREAAVSMVVKVDLLVYLLSSLEQYCVDYRQVSVPLSVVDERPGLLGLC